MSERTPLSVHDMVLVIYQDWPDVKAAIMRHDVVLDEHRRRIERVESAAENTGRHEVETLRKQLEKRDDRREDRKHGWIMWAAGIVAALLVSACTGAVGAVIAANRMAPVASEAKR